MSKKNKKPEIRDIDIPNPVVVHRLELSAEAFAEKVHEQMGHKPSADALRSILPASLLMLAAREASVGPVTMSIDDGEAFSVRPVDLQVAGMAMFSKAMMKLTTEIVFGSGAPMRLFDGGKVAPVAPKPRGYPAVAVYKASGEQVHGDDVPTGPRIRWLRFDEDIGPSRFATMDDAEAEADSMNFLSQQEERGEVCVAEAYVPEAVPPTPRTSRGDGSNAKRRRPRKPNPKKR